MATLGDKLQKVHARVNKKLGSQLSPVVFRKPNVTAASDFGNNYASTSNTDVTISAGAQVSFVNAKQTDALGTARVGDLRVRIPGHLITEAQIAGSDVLYGGLTYAIINYYPVQTYSAVVVNWEVIARIKR